MKKLLCIFILFLILKSSGYCSGRIIGGAFGIQYGLLNMLETKYEQGAGLKLSLLWSDELELDLLIAGYTPGMLNAAAGFNYLISRQSKFYISFKVHGFVAVEGITAFEPSIMYGDKLRLELGTLFGLTNSNEIYPSIKVNFRFWTFYEPYSY